MALMSIVLYFAIPRLDINVFSNNNRDFSTWLLLKVKSLKETAQRENTEQILYVDIDSNQMWSGNSVPADQSKDQKADQKTASKKTDQTQTQQAIYKMPDGLSLLDVEYPNDKIKSSGIAEIHFYPQGYSDKAIVHIEDKDNNRSSYLIEPFLSKIQIDDSYIDF